MRVLLALLLMLCMLRPAPAVEPDEMLKDPALEARARAISQDIRCLVCQGQDIDSSEAPLAADLRRLVRERLEKGDTDAQALQFIRARYGDYVMLDPPFDALTALLWAAPVLVLCAGAGVVFFHLRRQREGGGDA